MVKITLTVAIYFTLLSLSATIRCLFPHAYHVLKYFLNVVLLVGKNLQQNPPPHPVPISSPAPTI